MQFKYHPIPFKINREDFRNYQGLTEKIQRIKSKLKIDELDELGQNEEALFHLYLNRSKILKLSKNKLVAFYDLLKLLKKEGKLHHMVIYCEEMEEQLKPVIDILYNKLNTKDYRLFIGDTPLKERISIIQEIESGRIKMIVSMKCLRQGVDIPSLNYAILLSISGSELDWIQRIGRILRIYRHKPEYAEIYDFIAVSPISVGVDSIQDDPLYQNQERRINFLLDHSINKYQALDKLEAAYRRLMAP